MIKNEQAPYSCNIVGLQIAVTAFWSLDCCKHRCQGGTCSYSNLDPNIEKRKQTECERARWIDIAVNTGILYHPNQKRQKLSKENARLRE